MDNLGTVIVATISLVGTIAVGWFTFAAQRKKDDASARNDQLRIYNEIKRDVLQDVYAELEREQRKSQAIDQRVQLLENQLEDRVMLLENENERLRRENDALRAERNKGGRL